MNVATERKIIRWIHIIGGAIIAAFIYSPLSGITTLELIIKIVIIPLISISGIWLWKGQLIKRKFKEASR